MLFDENFYTQKNTIKSQKFFSQLCFHPTKKKKKKHEEREKAAMSMLLKYIERRNKKKKEIITFSCLKIWMGGENTEMEMSFGTITSVFCFSSS